MNIEETVRLALQEDIGDGDHTTLSTIPATATGRAKLLVKETGVLAGVEVAKVVFQQVDPTLTVTQFMNDGDPIIIGDIVFTVEGSSRSILSAERLALNFMQRMSGIATETASIVKLLDGLNTKVLDTRKTTPLLRQFEKYAVLMGGGTNHRFGLYDMMMIKDNHVDFAGGIPQAIDAANRYLSKTGKALKIEIEVRNFEELKQVLSHGNVDRIMLDNFTPEALKKAVTLIDHRYETEASGGITKKSIRAFAESGVESISVGALTHQIKSLDLSLKAF